MPSPPPDVRRPHRPGSFAAFAVALLGAVALCACKAPVLRDEVDTVVLLSIDSLRADHVGAHGYGRPTTPSIDALAARGTVFDRAYSTTSWTLPAHVSMLTGLEAETHGVIDDGQSIPATILTIAERAKSAGVETAGVYSGPYLQRAYGFGRGFGTYANCSGIGADDAGLGLDWGERKGTHRTSHEAVTNPCVRGRVAAWARSAPRTGKRFLFVHLWDVHYDYAPPPGYVEIFDPDYRGSADFSKLFVNESIRAGMPARDLRRLIALYDGEIRWTDDTIAGILADLDGAGLLRRSIVVVTADHGEEFFEHGGKAHRLSLHEEVLRVPMIVARPGGPELGRRSDEVVSLVDVAPAICTWLGLDCADLGPVGPLAEAAAHGRDRGGDDGRGRDDALAHLKARRVDDEAFRARVGHHAKVVERPGGGIEFYAAPDFPGSDLKPSESFDRAGLSRASAAAADSVGALDARVARAQERGRLLRPVEPAPTAAIDDATRERLESLGYLPTGRGEPQHGLAQGAPG